MSSPGGTPALDKGPEQPIKKGSAMDRLKQDLAKKAEFTPPEPPKPKPETETPAPETEETPEPETQETPEPETTPKPPTEKPEAKIDPKTGKPAKPNPWKLVDEWKGRATQLEKDLVEAKKSIVPEQERKVLETRAQSAEARVKELEDEIRYVNYEKHPEFIKNYQEPYEKAWKAATSDLSEISITDPQTKELRAATPQDLMELVSLPLGQARAIADQVFGSFADDIMAHRKAVKDLFQKKTDAVKEVKEQGSVREKQQRELSEKQSGELTKQITATWEKVNADALQDPKVGHIFKQREGDQEWNQRLGKGFELVDRAWSENPADPKLTPEQRASVIKRHAAVRHRAASWGAVVFDNMRKDAEIAAYRKELEAYKKSTPPPGGGEPSGEPAEAGSAMARMQARLRKLATPA